LQISVDRYDETLQYIDTVLFCDKA
jgi:hypothetical protein